MANNEHNGFRHLLVGRVVITLLVVVAVYFLVPMLGRHSDGTTVGQDEQRTLASLTEGPAAPPAIPTVDTLTGDTADEGQDVLMAGYDATPADLWNALADDQRAMAEWYDDKGTDGYGTFYIPVGAEVLGDDGAYIATPDGWSLCAFDVAKGGRCTPEPLDVPFV